jgi:hypothetical protein
MATTPRYASAMRGVVVSSDVGSWSVHAGRVASRVARVAFCAGMCAGCAARGGARGDRAVGEAGACAVDIAGVGTVVDSPSEARRIERHGLPAHQLSGIVHWHGDRYLAIGDDGAAFLWELRIAIDDASGALDAAEVVGSLPLAEPPRDGEALAWIDGRTRLLLADEEDSTTIEYAIARAGDERPARASFVARRAANAVFAPASIRPNLGLESLGAFDGWVWSASEDARREDGPCATVAAGAIVRIDRRDPSGAPAGQWAYRTDPVSARAIRADLERSGVVEIVPLARDAALVLERAVGGLPLPVVRSRLYAIDVRGATDIGSVASLDGAGVEPLAKRLLWEDDAAGANYEGLAIGPRLADGRVPLVLVADDGGGAMGQRGMVRVLLWSSGRAAVQTDIGDGR